MFARLVTLAVICLPILALSGENEEERRNSNSQVANFSEKVQAQEELELSEYKELREAYESGDLAKMKLSFDRVINEPIASFVNAFYAYGIKSTAYYYRSKMPPSSEIERTQREQDWKDAIDFGNLGAVQDMSEGYLRKDATALKFVAGLSKEEAARFFRTGADFGDPYSAASIAMRGKGDVSQDETIYWTTIAIQADIGISPERRTNGLHQLFQQVGSLKIANILSRFSLAGSPLPSSRIGLPPRGLSATVFVDNDLRGTFGRAYGGKMEPRTDIPESPTVRENFDFYSREVPDVARADAYMLAPVEKSTDQKIFPADVGLILSELIPGDRVFLSCGPLAHVAILYRRDASSHKLLFIDTAYEFWQPTHNDCVKNFELLEDKHHRYLSVVDEEDVKSMLVASITIRDPINIINDSLDEFGCSISTKWIKDTSYATTIMCDEDKVADNVDFFKQLKIIGDSVTKEDVEKERTLATSTILLIAARLAASEIIENVEAAKVHVTGVHQFRSIRGGSIKELGFEEVIDSTSVKLNSGSLGAQGADLAAGANFSSWYRRQESVERRACACKSVFNR